jgi:ubiquinone/menaquinone biosynthesis C-methylase UbiE
VRDKTLETLHNERILAKAEIFWGWATTAGQARVHRRVQLLNRLGNLGEGMKVLELGCGTGMFTQHLAKSSAKLTAVDLSHEFLRKASNRIAESPSLCACDAEKLCFRDNTFDCVVGISILHHLEIPSVGPEIKRVLKNGGTIVFTEPNMLNPQILVQKNIPFIKRLAGDSPDERAFTRWQMKTLLQTFGFVEVKVLPFDFVHPFIPAVAIRSIAKLGDVLERVPLVREIAGSLLISARLRK